MNNSVGKNNRYVRNMNQIGIVGLLREYGSLTKAEIAAKMNLTFTAVNNVLHESARYVGISLANIINLLTPETIILGGVLANRYPDFFNHVKETSVNRSLSSLHNKMVLQPSELGEDGASLVQGRLCLKNTWMT